MSNKNRSQPKVLQVKRGTGKSAKKPGEFFHWKDHGFTG